MNILGIDPGSKKMGFSILVDGEYSRSWWADLRSNTNIYIQTYEAVLSAFRVLESNYRLTADDLVVIEDFFPRGNGAKLLLKVIGVIMLVLARHDIPYIEVVPNAVKASMCGKIKTPKNLKEKKMLMINAVNQRFNTNIKDDNEADAVAIAYCGYLKEGADRAEIDKI